jgi:hypothetical protein
VISLLLPSDQQLAEREAAAAGLGTDQVDVVIRIAILEAMAHGFSINGDELASQFGTKGRNVGDEAFDETLWIKAREELK